MILLERCLQIVFMVAPRDTRKLFTIALVQASEAVLELIETRIHAAVNIDQQWRVQ
jgi:hypothetical protein